MHDAKGRPLAVGDVVLVPCTITQAHMTEEYCNLSLQTLASMYPGIYRTGFTVNAKQVIRANGDDDVTFTVVNAPDGSTSIR